MRFFYQDTSYEKAIPDVIDYFRATQQIKPKQKRVIKPIMLILPKNILDMFKIDLVNHRKARLALQYHLHGFTPGEIDNMWYMDFEYKLMDLAELLKEKQEAEKKAYDDQKANTPDYSKHMKGMKTPNFKTPSFPKF
jgi:hypothetical protein